MFTQTKKKEKLLEKDLKIRKQVTLAAKHAISHL